MLTAIVVGVATLSLGLALIVRINESYGTIEADEIYASDVKVQMAEDADAAGTSGEGVR
jgi:multicomponent Na+:H+ antiporter subunit C